MGCLPYVALLWAFPTPQTSMNIGSNWELSHLVDFHFKFHNWNVDASIIDMKSLFSLYMILHMYPSTCVNNHYKD